MVIALHLYQLKVATCLVRDILILNWDLASDHELDIVLIPIS